MRLDRGPGQRLGREQVVAPLDLDLAADATAPVVAEDGVEDRGGVVGGHDEPPDVGDEARVGRGGRRGGPGRRGVGSADVVVVVVAVHLRVCWGVVRGVWSGVGGGDRALAPLAGELDVEEGGEHLGVVVVLAAVYEMPLARLVGGVPFQDFESGLRAIGGVWRGWVMMLMVGGGVGAV